MSQVADRLDKSQSDQHTKKKTKKKQKNIWHKDEEGNLISGPLPKNYWRDREKVPPWSCEAKARWAEGIGEHVVGRLVRLAGYYPLPIPFLAKQEKLLDEAGLDISDITPAVIAHAEHLYQESTSEVQKWVIEHGGTYNGVGKRMFGDEVDQELDESGARHEGKRILLFGKHVTAILRWMGLDSWDYAEAKKALEKFDLHPADATIRIQLRAGKTGERGEPAELTEKQIDSLYQAVS